MAQSQAMKNLYQLIEEGEKLRMVAVEGGAALVDQTGKVVASGIPSYMMRNVTNIKPSSLLSNKYVMGGLAAVAVAAVGYGTYRAVKHYRNKKQTAA